MQGVKPRTGKIFRGALRSQTFCWENSYYKIIVFEWYYLIAKNEIYCEQNSQCLLKAVSGRMLIYQAWNSNIVQVVQLT